MVEGEVARVCLRVPVPGVPWPRAVFFSRNVVVGTGTDLALHSSDTLPPEQKPTLGPRGAEARHTGAAMSGGRFRSWLDQEDSWGIFFWSFLIAEGIAGRTKQK